MTLTTKITNSSNTTNDSMGGAEGSAVQMSESEMLSSERFQRGGDL